MVGGIIGNLQGLFDQVNEQVGSIAGQVGSTPQGWNAGVFNMIRSLSNNVILPIAGVILAIVMTMELMQLVLERNNMHDSVCFERCISNASNTRRTAARLWQNSFSSPKGSEVNPCVILLTGKTAITLSLTLRLTHRTTLPSVNTDECDAASC